MKSFRLGKLVTKTMVWIGRGGSSARLKEGAHLMSAFSRGRSFGGECSFQEILGVLKIGGNVCLTTKQKAFVQL